jgi:hypothetical protein
VACASESVSNIVFDLIDDRLTIPLKRLGLVTLFNGVNVEQTKMYIKISCESYTSRICEKYLDTWMRTHVFPNRATPLPQHESFLKSFLTAVGDPTPSVQENLATRMGLKYRNGIGELIYALVTCRPDISYAVVKCAQSSVNPHEIHYHALRHILKYIYTTKEDGIYFWRQCPNSLLPDKPLPQLRSSRADILDNNRPTHTFFCCVRTQHENWPVTMVAVSPPSTMGP